MNQNPLGLMFLNTFCETVEYLKKLNKIYSPSGKFAERAKYHIALPASLPSGLNIIFGNNQILYELFCKSLAFK